MADIVLKTGLSIPFRAKAWYTDPMDSFGFTRKKFLALSGPARSRHLIRWLTTIHRQMAANRMSPRGAELFFAQYEEIRSWTAAPLPSRPDSRNTRACLAYVSDAVHQARQDAGVTVRDDGLLPPLVSFRDRAGPGETIDRPGMEIQVALDSLRSLFNVGAIFRTCDAAGVSRIILGNTLGKERSQVRKTAMGACEWVDQEITADLGHTLLEKKRQGFRIIGVETAAGSRPCHCYAWPLKAVLVFGNEEYGISDHVMAVCDEFVHVPMFGKKNSLNVGAAAAVVLFQAMLSAGHSANESLIL